MSGHIEPKGVIVSQLDDLNTLHSVIVDELKQNDILTKYQIPPQPSIGPKPV